MDSLIFPEAETRLICQSFPEFCFCFFWRQSYVTTFSTCCYIQKIITPGIIYVESFHISPVAILLIIPVCLKLSGGRGRVELEMLTFLWREILLQTSGNSNPITILSAPAAETHPCPLKPVQVQQCWTGRNGSAVTVTSCCSCQSTVCIHYHRLHQKQLTGKEKDKLSKVHSVYCRKWNTSSHLATTPFWNTHTHTNKEWKKKCQCPCLPTRRMCPKWFP